MSPSQEYLKELSSVLLEYRNKGFLCDAVLVTGTTGFRVHSNILAAVSPQLQAALSVSESRDGLRYIYLHDFDIFTLEVAVYFMYTGIVLLPAYYKKDLALGASKDNRLSAIVQSLEKIGLSNERINKCEIQFMRLLKLLHIWFKQKLQNLIKSYILNSIFDQLNIYSESGTINYALGIHREISFR